MKIKYRLMLWKNLWVLNEQSRRDNLIGRFHFIPLKCMKYSKSSDPFRLTLSFKKKNQLIHEAAAGRRLGKESTSQVGDRFDNLLFL